LAHSSSGSRTRTFCEFPGKMRRWRFRRSEIRSTKRRYQSPSGVLDRSTNRAIAALRGREDGKGTDGGVLDRTGTEPLQLRRETGSVLASPMALTYPPFWQWWATSQHRAGQWLTKSPVFSASCTGRSHRCSVQLSPLQPTVCLAICAPFPGPKATRSGSPWSTSP